MDKTRKLRRYTRKDYTQVVDFPVEIVGRDGVVRRYSFEESIRLYQRRIASADSRYEDDEVAEAEVEHCRRRIAQLRRSYSERYGGEHLHLVEDRARPGLAGEVAAFLRRCLGVDDALDDVQVELAGELEHCQAYGVRPSEGGPAVILYLYGFDDPSGCPARDEFFAQVKVLQQLGRTSEGVESLIGFHHSADLGLILTGTGEVARELATDNGAVDPLPAPWAADEAEDAVPHRDAMVRLRRGDPDGALHAFVRAYEADPYRRSAYLGAAVVADQLGRYEEGLMAAEMGSRYFPKDPSLVYHLSVAHLRLGQTAEARQALLQAQAFEAHPHAVGFLRALIALYDGQFRTGRRHIRDAGFLDAGPDAELARGRRRVRAALGLLGFVRIIGLLTAALGAHLTVQDSTLGPAVLVLGFAVTLVSPLLWRSWLRWMVRRPGNDGIGLSSAATLAASGLRIDRSQ